MIDAERALTKEDELKGFESKLEFCETLVNMGHMSVFVNEKVEEDKLFSLDFTADRNKFIVRVEKSDKTGVMLFVQEMDYFRYEEVFEKVPEKIQKLIDRAKRLASGDPLLDPNRSFDIIT